MARRRPSPIGKDPNLRPFVDHDRGARRRSRQHRRGRSRPRAQTVDDPWGAHKKRPGSNRASAPPADRRAAWNMADDTGPHRLPLTGSDQRKWVFRVLETEDLDRPIIGGQELALA